MSNSEHAMRVLRERFARINASARLEGMEADPELIALQERVIRGEITPDEALRAVEQAFGVDPAPRG